MAGNLNKEKRCSYSCKITQIGTPFCILMKIDRVLRGKQWLASLQVPTNYANYKERKYVWDIIGLFLATRLMLVLVTYFGSILLTQEKYSGTPVAITTLLGSWLQWDAAVYVRIAQFGYLPPFDFAFFPLFPMLIALLAHLLPGPWNYLAAGMLISNVALLGALFVIYQLAIDAAGELMARRTLLYLCVFPTAFFFFAAYNESLFILLTAGTFLALQRQCWLLAGLLGGLAALTRSTGVLLVIPYLYQLWSVRASLAGWRTRAQVLLPIIGIPLGTALYALYCWQMTGNALLFVSVQYHWSHQLTWPWQGIWQALFEFFWNQPFGSFNQVHVLLDLSATLAFLLLLIAGRKRLPPIYSIWLGFLFASILLSSTLAQHDSLISNQRFVLEMFPAFITLAVLGAEHPRLHQTILWAFPALLATLSLLFVMGKWMV
jgi:Gpi18-like mannosyltransferase